MVKNFKQNLNLVQKRISEACDEAGRRASEVTLMAVSKRQPLEKLSEALEAGHALYGENRVQEALEKMSMFTGRAQCELIGHLQTNKARLAAEHFDRIQSVDRPKLIAALARHAEELGRKRLPILLQVNAAEDPAKFGCAVDNAPALVESALKQEVLALDGLMTIGALSDDPAVAQRCFARLRELRDALETQFGIPLPVLSMGMTGDLEIAIREGSTLIRVGTALFGERTY